MTQPSFVYYLCPTLHYGCTFLGTRTDPNKASIWVYSVPGQVQAASVSGILIYYGSL